MKTRRIRLAAAEAPDHRLYLIGGYDLRTNQIAAAPEIYDPTTDTWLPDVNPPVIQSLTINSGAFATNSTSAVLTLQAFDPDGAIAQMAFSIDGGATWSAWETFTTSKPWTLSSGTDGLRTVQARVRDAGGSISQVASDTILLETVAPAISSLSINGGALATISTTVSLSLAANDPASGSGVSQMALSNDGGGSWSTWEPFAATKSWTLAGGNGAKSVQARVRDAAGNVSQVASAQITLDGSLGSNPGLSINAAAIFTNTVDVTLSIIGPAGVAQMQLSNDGGFGGSSWEPFTTQKPWQVTQYGTAIVSRTVYVRFKDVGGALSAVYQDDIILDVTAPSGSVTVSGSGAASERGVASPARTVQLTATDDLSSQGQLQMRLSNRPDFTGAIWKPFASSVSWDFTGGTTVYAQFKDGAGNVSQTYSQSLAGSPSGSTGPTPNCSPRPRIDVRTEAAVGVPEAGGAIKVIVSTSGANNGFRAVRFDSFNNAVVHAGSQTNQIAPFAYSIPPGQEPTSAAFFVQRQTPGQSTTVRLVVIDGCGEWSTFVGGGPTAF